MILVETSALRITAITIPMTIQMTISMKNSMMSAKWSSGLVCLAVLI